MGWLKMAYFLISDFFRILSITAFITIAIKNVGDVLKNSENSAKQAQEFPKLIYKCQR